MRQRSVVRFRPDGLTGSPVDGRRLDRRIYLHDAISDFLEGRKAVSKRLVIAAQQLAAVGRTTIVKGCSDRENRGWRRTPLGGQGGMQYYLWWAPQGSPQTKEVANLQRGAVLLREVRHHDNHGPLRAGKLLDYHNLTAPDVAADSSESLESPWTEPQRMFVQDRSPVRVVRGYPGSGKTMALWKAVEARGGKTLYLSWSSGLVNASVQRFKAFASADSNVEAREYRVFTGSLCGQDVESLTLAESRERFDSAYEWWKIKDHFGPWWGNLPELHAELRAVLFGRAVPGLLGGGADGRRLADHTYLATTKVGEEAGAALLETIKRADWRSWYGFVFPELAAAHRALARIRSDRVPETMLGYDRVVVDEVQDLSLIEAAVITEYCRAVAGREAFSPRLMLAFDAGQTVRPSGFDPSRLSEMLSHELARPEEFLLGHNVRSPSLISGVVHRASRLYKRIDKDWRPKDQTSREVGEEIIARLIHVAVPDAEVGGRLVEVLGDVGNVAVISATGEIPGWVPEAVRDAIHTPETAKGLEYASACVLGVGGLLDHLDAEPSGRSPIELQACRTAIDGLRVTLSRATENLVLLDLAPSDGERARSLRLLETAEEFTPEDLEEFFKDADLPLDERILVRTRDAVASLDTAPERAWQRAWQCLRLLGEIDANAFEADEAVRREVCDCVLRVAARRIVDEQLSGGARKDVVSTARRVSSVWGGKAQHRAFVSLDNWTAGRARAPFALITSALALDASDGAWLHSALPIVLQRLVKELDRCAKNPKWARQFAGDVEVWLEVIGFTGEAAQKAAELRAVAAQSLAEAKDWLLADAVLSKISSPDPELAGLILENVSKLAESAEAYESASLPVEALRVWRRAGNVDRAIALAERLDQADLQWVSDLQWVIDMRELVARRPAQLEDRLTKQEKNDVNKMVRRARTPVRRKKRTKGTLL